MNFLGRSISLLINGYKCVRFNGMIVLSSNRPKLLTERLTCYKGNIKYGPFLYVSKVK